MSYIRSNEEYDARVLSDAAGMIGIPNRAVPKSSPPRDESREEFEKAWAASDHEATWGKHGKEAAWWAWQAARASGNGKEGV